MLSEPPPPTLDLLVVGALTIDRFADGSTAPGGSGMHIARAAASRRVRLGVVTAAGPEAVAQAGLDQLRRLAAVVEAEAGPETVTFSHRETVAGRQLALERRGAALHLDADALRGFGTRAILFAPVAGEIGDQAFGLSSDRPLRAAILQGWLRSVGRDAQVQPLPLDALDPGLLRVLGHLDLLVASREDLLAEGGDPSTQLLAVRRAVGEGPALALTDGERGLWLGTRTAPRHIAVPWRVEGGSTTGAGDILAAFMLIWLTSHPGAVDAAAERAMRIVAEVLEERKGG